MICKIAGRPEWRREFKLPQLRQGRLPNGADEGRGPGLAQELLPLRAVRQAAQRRQLREPRGHPLLQAPLQGALPAQTRRGDRSAQ